MSQRFHFLIRAFLALCLVLAVVTVPSNALVIQDEAKFKNRFQRLVVKVNHAFSFHELQCADNTSENVKACMERIIPDIPNLPSFCDWFSRINECILGGYDECANGNPVKVDVARYFENKSSEFGCTEVAHVESKRRRKREAGNEVEKVFKFQVMEAALSQLVSTFN